MLSTSSGLANCQALELLKEGSEAHRVHRVCKAYRVYYRVYKVCRVFVGLRIYVMYRAVGV